MASRFCLPANTCPVIDDVKEQIEQIADISKYVNQAYKQLEVIRDMNSELRKAAETWQDEIEQLEDENDELKSTIKDLEEQINKLTKQLSIMEKAA